MIHDDRPPPSIAREIAKAALTTLVTVTITKVVERIFDAYKQSKEPKQETPHD